MTNDKERIAKRLARVGIASRREAERMIEAGRVKVDGRVLESPALNVGPDNVIEVDGKVIGAAEETRLWAYHKPRGQLCTASDPKGRPTIFDHLPQGLPRVISVGRLDYNSEGLLLLTNDGELAGAMMHPSKKLVRRYRVRAFGHTTQEKLDGLAKGCTIDGLRYGPIKAKLDRAQGGNQWLEMNLTEGKNREIRKICEHLGLQVNRLIRTNYGPFDLGKLEQGMVKEIRNFKRKI